MKVKKNILQKLNHEDKEMKFEYDIKGITK